MEIFIQQLMKFLKIVGTCLFILLCPQFINATEHSEVIKNDLSDIEDYEMHLTVIKDPLEPLNRGVFTFNKGVDSVLIKPVVTIYHKVTPSWGRDRVSNFVQNLKEPVNIINAILQADPDLLAKSAGRFLTNSIIGLGGLFDVAGTQEELQIENTDFGLTLKKYGFEVGPYLVLPIIGPSSFRDAPCLVANYYADPFNYMVGSNTKIARKGVELIEKRDSLTEVYDNIEQTSIDEYASFRSIYMQKRQ